MSEKINVYLAGSMFCEADRMYNAYLAEKIRERCGDAIDLYVPQENLSINDKTKCADSRDIFWGDYNRLQNTDIFIARIDGDIPPSGTSAEVGIMSQRIQHWEEGLTKVKKEMGQNATHAICKDYYTKIAGNKPVILGLCTDSRNPKRTYLDAKNDLMKNDDYESQYCYFNLFTIGCIKVNGCLTTSVDELVDRIAKIVKKRTTSRYVVEEKFQGKVYDYASASYSNCILRIYNDGTSEVVKVE